VLQRTTRVVDSVTNEVAPARDLVFAALEHRTSVLRAAAAAQAHDEAALDALRRAEAADNWALSVERALQDDILHRVWFYAPLDERAPRVGPYTRFQLRQGAKSEQLPMYTELTSATAASCPVPGMGCPISLQPRRMDLGQLLEAEIAAVTRVTTLWQELQKMEAAVAALNAPLWCCASAAAAGFDASQAQTLRTLRLLCRTGQLRRDVAVWRSSPPEGGGSTQLMPLYVALNQHNIGLPPAPAPESHEFRLAVALAWTPADDDAVSPVSPPQLPVAATQTADDEVQPPPSAVDPPPPPPLPPPPPIEDGVEAESTPVAAPQMPEEIGSQAAVVAPAAEALVAAPDELEIENQAPSEEPPAFVAAEREEAPPELPVAHEDVAVDAAIVEEQEEGHESPLIDSAPAGPEASLSGREPTPPPPDAVAEVDDIGMLPHIEPPHVAEITGAQLVNTTAPSVEDDDLGDEDQQPFGPVSAERAWDDVAGIVRMTEEATAFAAAVSRSPAQVAAEAAAVAAAVADPVPADRHLQGGALFGTRTVQYPDIMMSDDEAPATLPPLPGSSPPRVTINEAARDATPSPVRLQYNAVFPSSLPAAGAADPVAAQGVSTPVESGGAGGSHGPMSSMQLPLCSDMLPPLFPLLPLQPPPPPAGAAAWATPNGLVPPGGLAQLPPPPPFSLVSPLPWFMSLPLAPSLVPSQRLSIGVSFPAPAQPSASIMSADPSPPKRQRVAAAAPRPPPPPVPLSSLACAVVRLSANDAKRLCPFKVDGPARNVWLALACSDKPVVADDIASLVQLVTDSSRGVAWRDASRAALNNIIDVDHFARVTWHEAPFEALVALAPASSQQGSEAAPSTPDACVSAPAAALAQPPAGIQKGSFLSHIWHVLDAAGPDGATAERLRDAVQAMGGLRVNGVSAATIAREIRASQDDGAGIFVCLGLGRFALAEHLGIIVTGKPICARSSSFHGRGAAGGRPPGAPLPPSPQHGQYGAWVKSSTAALTAVDGQAPPAGGDCDRMYEVRRSSIHGHGVFAMRPIKAGERIVEYVGEVIPLALADEREARYKRQRLADYMFRFPGTRLVIDATHKGNVSRLINHSCAPNCKSVYEVVASRKHIYIDAQRDIAPGEELTYDYKFPLDADPTRRVPCRCGASNCQGFMT